MRSEWRCGSVGVGGQTTETAEDIAARHSVVYGNIPQAAGVRKHGLQIEQALRLVPPVRRRSQSGPPAPHSEGTS